MSHSLKQKIHSSCKAMLLQKAGALQQLLYELTDSAANETKSSAGDKFETTRAMLHIEQDRVRSQIAEAAAQLAILDGIDAAAIMQRAALGSLITMDNSHYFLSTALGKITVDGKQVICLSMQSPLGTKMKGLSAGDSLTWNGRTLVIESVL